VREVATGRELTRWHGSAGQRDSGWIGCIPISYKAVHVEVWYDAGDGMPQTKMRILNPAPHTEFGWLARDVSHALEVEWPD